MQYVFAACRDTSSTRKRFSRNHIGSDPCIFFMLRKSDRPDSPPFSYFKNKTTDRILGFSNGLRKHRPTGFCVCQETFGPHIAYPPRRMELANFRAEKYANISRAKWVPDWCTFENNVIFGHLQGGSRVCTLLVYFFFGGGGSNWLTLVGLSTCSSPPSPAEITPRPHHSMPDSGPTAILHMKRGV